MRHKYLLLIIAGLTFSLVSCKKESNKYPVIGKWQETKLRLYSTDSTGAFLYDTTYLQPFTSADFIQFNNNGTVVIGTDHYYYPNAPGEHVPPQKITPITSAMNYTAVGSKFVLTSQSTLINPGGFDVRDTIYSINPNTLLFHSIIYSHMPGVKFISDAYYTK
jgi:hypothetical protein